MKKVEDMSIEECEREVHSHGSIDTICYTMDSADKAIRAAGYCWSRAELIWETWPVSGGSPISVEDHDDDNPALDLWRLATLVYRAKSGGGA